jgi:hypothetical protein
LFFQLFVFANRSTVPGEENMRRYLVMAISLLLLISFGCGGKSTVNNNENPPVITEPPEPPSGLHGEALSSSLIQLSWSDNSDNEDYFAIYRREAQIDTYTVCQRVFFNTTTCTDIELRENTSYSYFVRAERGDTSSRSSNTISVTTLAQGGITIVGALPFQGAGACFDNSTASYFNISTRNGMVYLINAFDLTAPQILESYQAPGSIYAIESIVGWHYLAMGERGIQSITMQYPAPPEILGNCDTPGSATGICRVGTIPDFYYYVVDGGSLQMFDGNSIPNIVGEFHNSSIPHIVDAVCDWSCVYLACGDSGIQLLDTTSPLSPTIQGHLNIAGGAGKVCLDAGTTYALQLYVLNASPNLYIIDVSIHTNLALLGAINIGNATRAIYVDGSFVYVAYHEGLKVVNVSNPSEPSLLMFYPDNHEISAVKAVDGYIYLVDNGGLKILQYTPPGQ